MLSEEKKKSHTCTLTPSLDIRFCLCVFLLCWQGPCAPVCVSAGGGWLVLWIDSSTKRSTRHRRQPLADWCLADEWRLLLVWWGPLLLHALLKHKRGCLGCRSGLSLTHTSEMFAHILYWNAVTCTMEIWNTPLKTENNRNTHTYSWNAFIHCTWLKLFLLTCDWNALTLYDISITHIHDSNTFKQQFHIHYWFFFFIYTKEKALIYTTDIVTLITKRLSHWNSQVHH